MAQADFVESLECHARADFGSYEALLVGLDVKVGEYRSFSLVRPDVNDSQKRCVMARTVGILKAGQSGMGV